MGTKRSDQAPDPADTLRARAEAQAREKAGSAGQARGASSPEAAQRLVHELQVHQIELEMQNEELHRAQAELEISHARYFDLYDMAPVGYFTLSEAGVILESNLAAAGLLGVARDALVQRPLERFVLPEDRRISALRRKRLFEEGTPQTFELRLLRADAAPFWARVEETAALDAAGAHVCRTVISDITELKRAEEERAAVEARLGQLHKAESLAHLAGAIAQQFRGLCLTVKRNLELAVSELAPRGKALENLVEAMRATNRSLELSTQMLTSVGQMVGKPEVLDLSTACRGSLPLLRAARLKDLVIETDLPSPGPIVRASANQIQQVLTVLIDNAWKAAGEGLGVIRLATRTVPAAAIPTAHRFPIDWKPQDAAHACLEVSDQGRGIPDGDIGTIFDPLFSESGPGLPVVLGIVRAHGGAVTVESEPGKGSTFRVFLPVSAEEAPPE
ncbi:MAG TPA: ATP-binding protein [Candidatus Methanoperedens sp.]|nr:ATP-binding protein [Candidatus Methanoperedens sp.]